MSDIQDKIFEILKRWFDAIPVMLEIGISVFVVYVIYQVMNRRDILKHSCYNHALWKVHKGREQPKDMLEEKFFQNPEGLWIHFRVWQQDPTLEKPKGLVLLLHGLAEHIDRHSHTAEYYMDKGYTVFGIDHQGFGRSEGDRAHVESFDHYIDDVIYFLGEFLPGRFPNLEDVPKFLHAHSMGSLIALLSGIKMQESRNVWHKLNGIILGNPAIGGTVPWYYNVLLPVLSLLFPKWEAFKFPGVKSTSFLSVKQQSFFDPLNYAGGLRPHHVYEFFKARELSQKLANKLSTSTLIFHGTEDLTASIEGPRAFCQTAKEHNPDIDLTMYELEGLYHEPLQEEKHIREPILDYIESWMSSRLNMAN